MTTNVSSLSRIAVRKTHAFILTLIVALFVFNRPVMAEENSGEEIYKYLSQRVLAGDSSFVSMLNTVSRELDWSNAEDIEFQGHLRFLTSPVAGDADQTRLFFIRNAENDGIR